MILGYSINFQLGYHLVSVRIRYECPPSGLWGASFPDYDLAKGHPGKKSELLRKRYKKGMLGR